MKRKVMLTKRNSSWGVKVRPQSTNVYEHIVDFATPELKDWFIARELFGDENVDWKELVRARPNKPEMILTDSKCEFRVSSLDYPNWTRSDFLNSDLAIILEERDDGSEVWTFWAINNAYKVDKAGNVYGYEGELDVFFTYDVKDLFKDFRVAINRAHANRFLANGQPDIFKDSINSFEEEVDRAFQFSFNNITNLVSHGVKACYVIVSGSEKEKKVYLYRGQYRYEVNGAWSTKEITNPIIRDPHDLYGALQAGIIFGVNLDDMVTNNIVKIMGMQVFNTSPTTKKSLSFSPIELSEITFTSTGTILEPGVGVSVTEYNEKGEDIGTEDNYVKVLNNEANDIYEIDIPFKVDMNQVKDITKNFDFTLEGKIYKLPYQQLEVTDILGSNYQLDISNMTKRDKISYMIQVKISQNGLHSFIDFNGNYFSSSDKTILYGLYGVYDTSTDKEINEWDQYEAYHKSQFGVQKASGIVHSIFGGINAIGSVASGIMTGGASAIVGGALGGANGVAGAWQGLTQTLAMQHDLQNAPEQIIGGGELQHVLTTPIIFDKMKSFYQINHRKPNDIVLQKLALVFHMYGVNYNGLMYNIKELIDNRYYFNHIQTDLSLFENVKDELKISQPLREVIDASFRNGITIWHVRDKATFKGIKQYDVNNVEMELLNDE